MVERLKDLNIPVGVSPKQDFVQILDPATGTGTFLVEVIDVIHKTLVAKWKAQGHGEKKIDALWNDYVPQHLLTRLHGYELLMAPYAIAHLKIGLKLYETGYRFGSDGRARIYLTNALEPPQDFSGRFEFSVPALAQEAKNVNEIKQNRRFTVVLGNPPYSGHSSNKGAWISDLLRTGLPDGAESYFAINGQKLGESNTKWLNDDYVKFMRLGQFLIASSNVGCLSYITNSSYLDNPTFRAMRASMLTTFSRTQLLNLHGSVKKSSSESVKTDENVFDIQQGVAVNTSCRGHSRTSGAVDIVTRADLMGQRALKYLVLLGNAPMPESRHIAPSSPEYLFAVRNNSIASEFLKGHKITDVMPEYSIGTLTKRDDLVIGMTANEVREKILSFVDSKKTTLSACSEFGLKTSDNDMWDAATARKSVKPDEVESYIRRERFRPFDDRWIFYHKNFVARLNRRVMQHLETQDNLALVCVRQLASPPFYHAWVVNNLVDQHIISVRTKEGGVVFPLSLQSKSDQSNFLEAERNLSPQFVLELTRNLSKDSRKFGQSLSDKQMFQYIYAQLFSPTYRLRYQEELCRDFPRVFVTSSTTLFSKLEKFGSELIALHLLQSDTLNHPITEYLGRRAPEVEKPAWSKNTVWIDKAQTTGFTGVSEVVWNFHIGGYQVCEKWLKDRKGRKLSKDDIAHYQKIIVALSETIRLMKEIDEVIEQHGGWPKAFQTCGTAAND